MSGALDCRGISNREQRPPVEIFCHRGFGEIGIATITQKVIKGNAAMTDMQVGAGKTLVRAKLIFRQVLQVIMTLILKVLGQFLNTASAIPRLNLWPPSFFLLPSSILF